MCILEDLRAKLREKKHVAAPNIDMVKTLRKRKEKIARTMEELQKELERIERLEQKNNVQCLAVMLAYVHIKDKGIRCSVKLSTNQKLLRRHQTNFKCS
ncbi:hypothetical protein Fmac_025008 [Flemingia macrophylla]|uniref:Uncharacterized protein n=1 Tax=Flemingia macrophylla TaxID=520843 RepID=A0ABD1LQZ8_9FABA